jgi:hypothetical protein
MKLRPTFATLLVLLLATTIATTQPSSATALDHGPTAFGQGEFFNIVRNETWRFSFEAAANKNGQARGRATFNIVDGLVETQVVVRIDCLNAEAFDGGSSAIMSGTILHSDNPDFPKRTGVFFNADDNSGLPPIRSDLISPLFVTNLFGSDCHDVGHLLTVFQVSPDAITIEP